MDATVGLLKKMRVEQDSPVRYKLLVGDKSIELNPLLGQTLSLRHTGTIVCINCNRVTRKSFSQGYCYGCFMSLAECDQCVMSPEKCHYHLGTCRDPAWGESHCMQPHYVYLSNSSGLKVGITRANQLPTRWIDQGAVAGMVIAEVRNRHLSGLIEAALRQFVSDRTSWQKMLKGDIAEVDLNQAWAELYPQVKGKLDELKSTHGEDAVTLNPPSQETQLQYPVEIYPQKIKSINLDKNPLHTGALEGIKGQYLIFDTGVINIRKYTGYEIEFQVHS